MGSKWVGRKSGCGKKRGFWVKISAKVGVP